MTRRQAILVCVAFLPLGSVARAQAGGVSADPITGAWTGVLKAKNGPPPADVVFHLQFDGATKVTGTFTGLRAPGDVKKGTFDSKTGILELQLAKENDEAVLLTLTGKVVKNTIAGTFTGEFNGDFSLVREP